ncbi:MAG: RodZ domain-containing protein [Marinobacter sp.]|uniref:RodZ domain-containing protein n=1 Tax=Marinobacter sp. TaxID=50741 RepID=UPI0034A09E0C
MTSEDTSPSVNQGSAGTQLRQAREAAGLTVAQVAESQHLRPTIIQAIEEGNYSQVDSELFLKGYVRTYAGTVGLNPDSVVASLDKELEPLRKEKAAAEEINPLQDIERRKRQKARVAKGIVLILVVIVLGLLAQRFISLPGESFTPEPSAESESATDPQESPVDESVEESIEDGEFQNEGRQIEPPEETEDFSPGSGSNGDSEIADVESGVDGLAAEFSTDGNAENLTGGVAVSEATDNVDLVVENDSGAPAEVADMAQPESESQNTDTVDQAQNLFTASFSDDCWVQITDASGQTLVAAIRRAGERISVEGTPPLRIVLGAADAVEQLEFAGESVDLSSYRAVNNRVEFTLDV